MELTLEEKTNGAVSRAREIEAEKHFYDAGQPHYPGYFSVSQRGRGHWDVSAPEVPGRASAWLAAHEGGKTSAKDGQMERAFRIRGEPGNVQVIDERWNPHNPHPREWMTFRSIAAAMLWISEELMQEPPLSNGDRNSG
jgi:hypothetical protein